MSHIAEGTLHAYLDGAADDQDPGWLAGRLHLSDCEDCARRLEEARRLRDGASALLREADTPARPRPSFTEIEALAAGRPTAGPDGLSAGRTRPAQRRVGRRLPAPGRLAWAASLVLAAGAGWMGRQMAVQEGVFSGAAPAGEAQTAVAEVRPAANEQLSGDQRGNDDGAAVAPAEVRAQDRDELAKAEEEPDLELPRRQVAPAGGRDAALADAAEDNAASVAGRAAPESDVDAVALRERADAPATAARCYRPAEASRLAALRIGPGRTAAAVIDGRDFVGYWVGPPGPGGVVSLSLSDGAEVIALSGTRTEQDLALQWEPDGAYGEEFRLNADAEAVTLRAGACDEVEFVR